MDIEKFRRTHEKIIEALECGSSKAVVIDKFEYSATNEEYPHLRLLCENAAKNEATKLNLGLSDVSGMFPPDRYCAVYAECFPDAAFEVLLLRREELPEAWRTFIEGSS